MTKAFAKILARATEKPFERVASTLNFESLDTGNISKRLRLEKKGEKRGSENKPAKDAKNFDVVENDIISLVLDEKKRCVEAFTRNIETYGERQRSLDFEGRLTDIKSAVRNASADYVASVESGENELHQKRRQVVEHSGAVERFCAENGLTRPAHYPSSRILHWGAIAVLLLSEIALNTIFLSKGHEFGIIGGFGESIGIAMLNVLLGLAAGVFVLTGSRHKKLSVKFFCILLLLGYILLAIIFNFFVAHYRDALGSALPEAAASNAVISFWQSPFELADFQSWILIGMGLSFSLLALLDGFKMDDPYPGYGRISRDRDSSETDYANTKDILIDETVLIRDRTIDDMQVASRDLNSRREEFLTIRDWKSKYVVRFEQHMEHLEQSANHLLEIYREADRFARSDEAPDHFSERWELKRPESEHVAADVGPSLERITKLIENAQKSLSGGIETVNDQYEAAITGYKQIEALVSGDSKLGTE
jgi:hypothetical protein